MAGEGGSSLNFSSDLHRSQGIPDQDWVVQTPGPPCLAPRLITITLKNSPNLTNAEKYRESWLMLMMCVLVFWVQAADKSSPVRTLPPRWLETLLVVLRIIFYNHGLGSSLGAETWPRGGQWLWAVVGPTEWKRLLFWWLCVQESPRRCTSEAFASAAWHWSPHSAVSIVQSDLLLPRVIVFTVTQVVTYWVLNYLGLVSAMLCHA